MVFFIIRGIRGRKVTRQRIEWVCNYISAVNEQRYFPAVTVNINLEPGEIGLLQENAQLSDMRSHRYSTGGSVRIAKGVWVGGRRYHSDRTREIVDRGTVVITTRRIAFIGGAKTAQVLFRDLISIEGGVSINIIHTRTRQTAIVVHYEQAMLGALLVKLFVSGGLSGNRLPDGWTLTARPKSDGVDLRFDKATPALAS